MEWISVEDDYPKETGRYLVVLVVGSISQKTDITMRRISPRNIKFKDTTLGDWQRMTHWMPLPELPITQK